MDRGKVPGTSLSLLDRPVDRSLAAANGLRCEARAILCERSLRSGLALAEVARDWMCLPWDMVCEIEIAGRIRDSSIRSRPSKPAAYLTNFPSASRAIWLTALPSRRARAAARS
jgi:hypothetical protein